MIAMTIGFSRPYQNGRFLRNTQKMELFLSEYKFFAKLFGTLSKWKARVTPVTLIHVVSVSSKKKTSSIRICKVSNMMSWIFNNSIAIRLWLVGDVSDVFELITSVPSSNSSFFCTKSGTSWFSGSSSVLVLQNCRSGHAVHCKRNGQLLLYLLLCCLSDCLFD